MTVTTEDESPQRTGAAARRAMEARPRGYFLLMQAPEPQRGPSVSAVFRSIRQRWVAIALGGLAGAALVGAAASFMEPLFRAQVVVVPVGQQGGLASSLGGQLGGLAALAGVDLSGTDNQRDAALAMLSSDRLLRELIAGDSLLPVLFAEDWDPKTKKWRVPVDEIPTLEDGVRLFRKDIRLVLDDKKSGLVHVQIFWSDAGIAAAWANTLVRLANQRLRAEAIESAQRSTTYLTRELERTTLVESRQAVARLLETQINSAMLASAREQYAFRVIDPAVPPLWKDRTRPRIGLMAAMGAVLGVICGVAIVLWRRRDEIIAAADDAPQDPAK